MSNEVHINFFGSTLTINNPTDTQEWVDALKDDCDSFAQRHYSLEYYAERDFDLSDDNKSKLAESLIEAITAFRKEEIPEGSTWQDVWKSHFIGTLYDMAEVIGCENDQYSAMMENDFEDLYESIDEAMSDIDGPVADAQAVYEALKDYTLEKMSELDHSSPLDLFGNSRISFTYTPRVEGDSQYRSDLMAHFTDFENEGPDEHFSKLLMLLGVKGEDLLERFDVDFTDRKVLNKWDKLLACNPDKPSNFTAEDVVTVLDNMGDYALPMWVGFVEVRDIANINFKEPVVLQGGQVGCHNYLNGSGYMMDMDDHTIVIDPDQILDAETRYTVKDTYGLMQSAMNAKIGNLQSPEKKAEKKRIFSNDSSPDF